MTSEQNERYVVALEKIAEKLPGLVNALNALQGRIANATESKPAPKRTAGQFQSERG